MNRPRFFNAACLCNREKHYLLPPAGRSQRTQLCRSGSVKNYRICRKFNENGEVKQHISYIIGLQRIAQIITDSQGNQQEHYFTFDGHGSTRVLVDYIGAAVQLYSFDAYGNALGFNPAEALTEFLYSGEQFDAKIGQQYLRARYYDPATGRFNRLDPFFGNHTDPQSFHKYLYCHADPINGVDPTGLFLCSVGLCGFMPVAGVYVTRTDYDRSVIVTGTSVVSRIQTLATVRDSVLLLVAAIWLPETEWFLPEFIRYPEEWERSKINAAISLIQSTTGFEKEYPSFIGVFGRKSQDRWGHSPNMQWYSMNSNVYLNEKALELPSNLLASLIVHEVAHSHQFAVIKGLYGEFTAYQAQSDFLNKIGVHISIKSASFTQQYPNPITREWIIDQAESFKIYGVRNPAITQ